MTPFTLKPTFPVLQAMIDEESGKRVGLYKWRPAYPPGEQTKLPVQRPAVELACKGIANSYSHRSAVSTPSVHESSTASGCQYCQWRLPSSTDLTPKETKDRCARPVICYWVWLALEWNGRAMQKYAPITAAIFIFDTSECSAPGLYRVARRDWCTCKLKDWVFVCVYMFIALDSFLLTRSASH
ncbi:hypothetical protein BaRGS_00024897 [Batillaria attramentaria]|uniref:Uncharacterized protein n=1 Tax=Batillaria attramentaria TaxID=370345 RepID=A0ABD0K9T8_9CAEN